MTETVTKNDKIFILLPKYDTEMNSLIVKHLLKYVGKNYVVKIIKCNKHIIESTIEHIGVDDYVFWNPNLAGDNIYLLKKFRKSIVVLRHKTFYLQKKNKHNPITENMAINHNFKLSYIDNDTDDINDENLNYSMIVDENYYLFDMNKLK